MGLSTSYYGKRRIANLLIGFAIIATVCICNEIVIEKKETTLIISKDEELNQMPIGPLNKYKLLNSVPKYFASERKKRKNNLILIYDTNL